jgi:hypothetical protein
MLKKAITYTDPFTEEEVTRTFYFNLTKAELTKLLMRKNGTYLDYMQDSINSGSSADVFEIFETFVREGYGERTEDGRFIKSAELSDAFMHSEAYSVLLTEFLQDTEGKKITAFFDQMCPKDLMQQVKANGQEALINLA